MIDRAITTRSRRTLRAAFRRGIAMLVALTGLSLVASWLSAQEGSQNQVAPPAENVQSTPKPSIPIKYVGPDTYILLDAEGRPQPVPGMTYEDFLAAWKKLNHAEKPVSQPRYSIENIKIKGQTIDQRAELKLTATVRVLADGAVDVPLGLVGAILQGEPRLEQLSAGAAKNTADQQPAKTKAGNEFFDFDPERGGFIARLNGNGGQRRTISVDLIVPLLRDGVETTLSLNLPRSVASSLSMEFDSRINQVRTSSGTLTTKKPDADGGTRVDIVGPTGQLRLNWQAASKDAISMASVLNAVGAIHISIDGRGVRSDAQLIVRSLGGTFDQFRVRLPRGATLIPGSNASSNVEQKYRITDEPAATGAKETTGRTGQVVLVELKEKQQGPVVVDLSTEQSGDDPNQALELAGFEVLGAVRQYGDIGLTVANDWQARWSIGRDIRQVDPTELNKSLQRSDLTAAFQYDRQPWSLGVRVLPRQSRVHVTPYYDLELLPDEARLTVKLAYQNFGARAFEFQVETDGWERSGESVESSGLVDQDRVTVTPKGTLILPLAQASTRKAEVTFSLRRSLPHETTKLELPLPVPLADSVATGELTIHVPADTELVPDLTNSTGLAIAPAREAAGTADAETAIHLRTLLPNAVFVATRANRKREESAALDAQIDIGADYIQVEQRIDYTVKYEAVQELVLEAAGELAVDEEGLQIALLASDSGTSNGNPSRTPLRFETLTEEIDIPAETHRIRIMLPDPRVGEFTIGARYRIPLVQPPSSGSTLQVPLQLPFDTHVVSQRAIVVAQRGMVPLLSKSLDATSWKISEVPRKKNSAGIEFVAEQAEANLPLQVNLADAGAPSTTIVDRVWLQTWLSGGVEQDRAAFRLRTSRAQTMIELPPDAPPGEIEVLVDGKPAEVTSRTAGRIIVRLGQDSPNPAVVEPTTRTLEIRFRRPIQQALISRHRITPPRIDATTELSQIYWQIVLPADEHIIRSPEQLVSASQWQWLGSFCGRRPTMSQSDLEQWVGASSHQGPASADNQYVYTGLLPVSSVAFVTAPRWLIVLLASASAMVLICSWFYLPISTRPWMLVGVILVIVAAAIAYPTAAMLIAQAAAIGVVLGLLATLIARLSTRPGRRILAPAYSPSSQRVAAARTDSIVMPSVMAAASTAPTVTLRTSDSER